MKGLLVEQIRRLEGEAKKIGLDERLLIENASSNLFSQIDNLKLGQKVLVISGRGNNGADVLSCARKLASRGYNVTVAVLEEKELGSQARFQKAILEKIGLPFQSLKGDSLHCLCDFLKKCDFVLDGILGIGLKGEVSPFIKKVVTLINQSKKKIVSCDIPSGLSPDKGIILGAAIKADYTITFIAPKQGFFLNQGPSCCGKVLVADIGISREILERLP